MGTDPAISDVAARIRTALDRHAQSGGPLPALLADLKHVLHDLPPEETPHLREVLAALRAVGRAWSQQPPGEATLTIDTERDVHHALAALREAVDRLE